MTTITYSAELDNYTPNSISATQYESLCKHRNCYEILPTDTPVKLYFDVDIKTIPENKTDGQILLTEMPRLRASILNVFSSVFEEQYDPTQLSISTSHHPFYKPYNTSKRALDDTHIAKLSFHFVFNNIIALVSHQKILVERLNESAKLYIDSEDLDLYFHGKVFDDAPYMKTQKMRSPYANKPFEDRPLKIEQGTFEQSCISAFIPSTASTHVEYVPMKSIQEGSIGAYGSGGNYELTIFKEAMNAGLLTPYAKAGTYQYWIRIIWAIRNIFNNPDLAHEFSRLCPKTYDRDAVDKIWDDGERGGVGMGTIIEYMRKTDKLKANDIIKMANEIQYKHDLGDARKELIESLSIESEPETDNESNASVKIEVSYDEQYAQQEAETIKTYIKTKSHKFMFGTQSGYNTAMLFIEVFGHRFITCNEQTYFYTGYVWKTSDKNLTDLHKFLCREFYVFIGNLCIYWNKRKNKQLAETTDEQKINSIKHDILMIGGIQSAIYGTLTNIEFRAKLVREIVIQHTDNSIQFNALHHLFAFNNAIFDLRKNEHIAPNPAYYISMTTGYDYDFNYSKEKVAEITQLINIIHQNPDIRDYYLSIMSTVLSGIHPQYLFIFTGVGQNGKGTMNKLIIETLGEYGYTATGTLLTDVIKDGANPAIANMDQKRCVITQEPAKGTKLNMSTTKRITGENTLNARKLYSSKTTTELFNTLIMEANIIPKTDEVNDAVIRRLRIIPFLTRAVEKADYEAREDKTNICIKNTQYDTKEWRENYKQAFFEVLRLYCKQFYERGDIPEPPEICKKATNAHLAISDNMHAWLLDNYVESPDASPIKIKDIFEKFKSTEAYLSLTKQKKREFNMATFCEKLKSSPFIAKFVKLRDSYYKGKQLKFDCIVGWNLKTEDYASMYEEEDIDMEDM